mmetsp:Transcript_7654/g.22434  ORF Transcript_7654/g.22434 Transcript_7654/m.22434 type:complete len:271 (-) Transcript_7654:155-967(-)
MHLQMERNAHTCTLSEPLCYVGSHSSGSFPTPVERFVVGAIEYRSGPSDALRSIVDGPVGCTSKSVDDVVVLVQVHPLQPGPLGAAQVLLDEDARKVGVGVKQQLVGIRVHKENQLHWHHHEEDRAENVEEPQHATRKGLALALQDSGHIGTAHLHHKLLDSPVERPNPQHQEVVHINTDHNLVLVECSQEAHEDHGHACERQARHPDLQRGVAARVTPVWVHPNEMLSGCSNEEHVQQSVHQKGEVHPHNERASAAYLVERARRHRSNS